MRFEEGQRVAGSREAVHTEVVADPMNDLGETMPLPAGNGAAGMNSGDAGPALVFLKGPCAGQVIPLGEGRRTLVGRIETADVTIRSRAVSKEHCAIIFENGSYSLEDLRSTNGVLVNDVRIAPGEPRPLFHGDNVRIADCLALFRHEGNFQGPTGQNRIHIDSDKVRAEVDTFLKGMGFPVLGPRDATS